MARHRAHALTCSAVGWWQTSTTTRRRRNTAHSASLGPLQSAAASGLSCRQPRPGGGAALLLPPPAARSDGGGGWCAPVAAARASTVTQRHRVRPAGISSVVRKRLPGLMPDAKHGTLEMPSHCNTHSVERKDRARLDTDHDNSRPYHRSQTALPAAPPPWHAPQPRHPPPHGWRRCCCRRGRRQAPQLRVPQPGPRW